MRGRKRKWKEYGEGVSKTRSREKKEKETGKKI